MAYMGKFIPEHSKLAVSASQYWRTAYMISIAGEDESFEKSAAAGIEPASAKLMGHPSLNPAPVGDAEKQIAMR